MLTASCPRPGASGTFAKLRRELARQVEDGDTITLDLSRWKSRLTAPPSSTPGWRSVAGHRGGGGGTADSQRGRPGGAIPYRDIHIYFPYGQTRVVRPDGGRACTVVPTDSRRPFMLTMTCRHCRRIPSDVKPSEVRWGTLRVSVAPVQVRPDCVLRVGRMAPGVWADARGCDGWLPSAVCPSIVAHVPRRDVSMFVITPPWLASSHLWSHPSSARWQIAGHLVKRLDALTPRRVPARREEAGAVVLDSRRLQRRLSSIPEEMHCVHKAERRGEANDSAALV
jgi:hypothetical protein